MNIFAVLFILTSLLLGVVAAAYEYGDWKDKAVMGLAAGGICLAVVLGMWSLIAVPLSDFKKDICQETAQGYGLERSEWSLRHGCRLYLTGGQLIPEERIRVTTDGDIIVTGDEG